MAAAAGGGLDPYKHKARRRGAGSSLTPPRATTLVMKRATSGMSGWRHGSPPRPTRRHPSEYRYRCTSPTKSISFTVHRIFARDGRTLQRLRRCTPPRPKVRRGFISGPASARMTDEKAFDISSPIERALNRWLDLPESVPVEHARLLSRLDQTSSIDVNDHLKPIRAAGYLGHG